MTEFIKIGDLDVVSSLADTDKFIVETLTGTKACTRDTLREETEITKSDIGLGNVDNTSDLNKPISNAMASALLGKLDVSTFNTTIVDFLTKVDAASTYLTQNNASGTYLSKTDAATYYVQATTASSVYATKTEVSSMLPSATASSVYATKTEAEENITTKTFTVLTTTTQTVLGAINEVNGLLDGLEDILAEI